jgi:hypothetical protein
MKKSPIRAVIPIRVHMSHDVLVIVFQNHWATMKMTAKRMAICIVGHRQADVGFMISIGACLSLGVRVLEPMEDS